MFDDLICVDWSAAAAPRTGADSIWVAATSCSDDGQPDLRNIATRRGTFDALFDDLSDAVAAGRRVLCGFDFPLGYPATFADRAGLGGDGAPWKRLWRYLAAAIADEADNANNRFAVATDLNRRLGQLVFWGCPSGAASAWLPMRKPRPWPDTLAEFRLCERRAPGRPQPVWKLAYSGSVGSQALTGIPVLARLRQMPALAPYTRIWPFETAELDWAALPRPLLVIAEVYPSLFDSEAEDHPVKDARQVRAACRALNELQTDGRMVQALSLAGLSGSERRAVIEEEAWILGV